MDSLDREVLEHARDWFADGRGVWLVTVLETWGSAPRPPGALLALRDDGLVMSTVSGGCVEDDLIKRVQTGERVARPSLGIAKERGRAFGLPCGGTLRLLQEPLADARWIDEVHRAPGTGRTRARNGTCVARPAQRGEAFAFDGRTARAVFGPRYRLLMIGAGQLRGCSPRWPRRSTSRSTSDPREEYYTRDAGAAAGHLVAGHARRRHRRVQTRRPHRGGRAHPRPAKLDDLALIEALKSPAFYVGALGSRNNTTRRRERLALFDLSADEIARLHGPIGLHIGSRTPAEIAVAILAEDGARRRPRRRRAGRRRLLRGRLRTSSGVLHHDRGDLQAHVARLVADLRDAARDLR